jgi:hypothetical protein
MTGNAMAGVAIPWFVLQTTGSAAKTGFTFAVIGLSNVLAAFFGGASGGLLFGDGDEDLEHSQAAEAARQDEDGDPRTLDLRVQGAKKNPNPIPNMVGMRVETACRTLLRKEHLGYVWGKRSSEEFGARRVVAQKPEAGFKPGVPHGVFLFVSRPFPDVLPRDTSCAERTVGPID